MFERESEMAPIVTHWMREIGMTVKAEFCTPWGICDLVGARLNEAHVAQRLRLRQRKSVRSITRAAILLRVPDVESTKSTTVDSLTRQFALDLSRDEIVAEIDCLVADRFVIRTSRGRLQQLNGWLPLQERFMAVELKLRRIDNAFQQARLNLAFADESFVAFPMPIAERINSRRARWNHFIEEGVGLMGVNKSTASILIASNRLTPMPISAVQFCSVEKFWEDRKAH